MTNVTAHVPATTNELASLVRDHLDGLVTYATHLVGDPEAAMEFVAGGIYHATKYPPARLRVDGKAALYRAVTRACRMEQRFPPRPHAASRFLRRQRPAFFAEVDAGEAARMNTVKRALTNISFERRAALLLRDLGELPYRAIATALECSPEAAARLLAGARREFGSVYREIAL